MDYIYRDYMGELYMGGLYMGDSIRTIYAGMYMGIYDKSSFYISYGSKNNPNVGCQLITFTTECRVYPGHTLPYKNRMSSLPWSYATIQNLSVQMLLFWSVFCL